MLCLALLCFALLCFALLAVARLVSHPAGREGLVDLSQSTGATQRLALPCFALLCFALLPAWLCFWLHASIVFGLTSIQDWQMQPTLMVGDSISPLTELKIQRGEIVAEQVPQHCMGVCVR